MALGFVVRCFALCTTILNALFCGSPMKLQGNIILGTGGDNSEGAEGTFFEGAHTFDESLLYNYARTSIAMQGLLHSTNVVTGAMTASYAPAEVDDAIQANIVAAGYGK